MDDILPRSWAGFRWEPSYSRLPPGLFRLQKPTPVRAPSLVVANDSLAVALGLDPLALRSTEGVQFLAGNRLIEGTEPLALAYSGHQFGYFTTLGDGRAILVGEHRTAAGALVDVQWKGSGRTAFSRGGDGRLALGPALREFLISEAMAALRVPTTRSLSVVATGETVFREEALPGAVLVRIASSHLRVGTFEGALTNGGEANVTALVDFAIRRHFPTIDVESADRVRAFYSAVIDRQVDLIAHWLSVGFVHGVMNTDNTSIAGETIDYGPCAFLDTYASSTVFSSIDRNGRYAFGQQPGIAGWNLARLGDTLVPILGADAANEILNQYPERFAVHFSTRFGAKLGLAKPTEADAKLAQDFLSLVEQEKLDFHEAWRSLESNLLPNAFQEWGVAWSKRLAEEGRSPVEIQTQLRQVNPRIIPRNHQVEAALLAAGRGDLGPFERLLAAVRTPFADTDETRTLGAPPADGNQNYRTFCGT